MRKRVRRLSHTLAVVCCFALAACGPEGGHLLPLEGEGVELLYLDDRGRSARASRGGVALTSSGNWEAASVTNLTITVENTGATPVQLDFGRVVVVNGQGTSAELVSVSESPPDEQAKSVSLFTGRSVEGRGAPVLDIGQKTRREFVASFQYPSPGGEPTGGKMDDTVRLRVSVGGAGGPAAEFTFGFRYVGR